MIIWIARESAPDAEYWSGRRMFAAVDAMAWPAAWIAFLRHLPPQSAPLETLLDCFLIVYGLNRLHRAIWINHRYRFSTWRWGKVFVGPLILWGILKLMT